MDYALRARLAKRFYRFLSYTLLIGVAIIIIMPLAAMATTSIKQMSEYNVWPINILPRVPQWSNYAAVFEMAPYLKVALRTAALGIIVTIIVTASSSLIGFAFARYPVKGSKPLFFIVVGLMIIPYIVVLIPQFVMYSRLHLTNTYWPWIFGAVAGNSFYIFLFRQFFLSFPRELEDAAEVDGAGPFRIFWQIFLPNAKPVIAAVMIFAFSYIWGDYMTPLILLNDDKTLLSVKIATSYSNPQGVWLITIALAANLIYMLPLVIVFFLAQKHILKGVVTSGLKG
ncbi:MAG TPA: carbohydrate ABC transporter permease [Anaerolineales bacterium]